MGIRIWIGMKDHANTEVETLTPPQAESKKDMPCVPTTVIMDIGVTISIKGLSGLEVKKATEMSPF